MSILIVRPGLFTTVQDGGRFGSMSLGFTQCGAMDYKAAKTANLLIGNNPNDAVLEMTYTGIAALFREDCAIALSGAHFKASINTVPIKTNKAYKIKAGDVLSMREAISGARAYLAISGGIDVPQVLGSRSTDLKLKLGGFEGRALKCKDEIKIFGGELPNKIECREIPEFEYGNEITLRCVLGPQDDMFTSKSLETLFSEEYKVSAEADRMGIRLSGAALKCKSTPDIISDGIAFGAVQVPKNGQPIILAADRQTTGGYAKPITVITADLPFLAQAKPGNTIRFKPVSLAEAEAAAKEEQRFFEDLRF